MICQNCGIEAPTRKVAFYQNIGALVVRFSQGVDGLLCKNCIHRSFWRMTLTTLILGWWGIISLIVTPIFLLNNIFRYLFSLSMPPVPEDAVVPQLTDDDRRKIIPHVESLFDRLNEETADLTEIANEFATRIGVTPGQIVLAIREIATEAQAENPT